MASWIQLYLDVETNGYIIAPQFTTNDAITHIRIVSAEILTEIYDFKIVDALGVEHIYPNQYPNAKELDIEIIFLDFPLGVTTIYATIRDTVNNIQTLVPKTFTIYEATRLSVAVDDAIAFTVNITDELPVMMASTDERPVLTTLTDG